MTKFTPDYERTPYVSLPIPTTAPELIAMTSWFHGGPRPPVEGYRVLEIGCGEGTNLLGLAFYRPDAQFLGIDTSSVQIARAREGEQSLDLKNIQFTCGDVHAHASAFPETFHYIIVHGVFSWIDDDARAGILDFCHEHLGDDGIVYISYNTLPGWSVRGVVRDLILRSGVLPAGADPLPISRELVDRLKPLLPSRENKYAALLEDEFERLFNHEDSYLVHEYFSEYNRAFWFRDFVGTAENHGLEYVAEMQFNRPEGRVPPELYDELAKAGVTGLHAEEMVDAICFRQFRMSLLCRSDAIRKHRFLAQDLREVFVASESGDLATEWPQGKRLDGAGTNLLELYRNGEVNLRLREPVWGGMYANNPKAHSLARFEAARGGILTTPLHSLWPLDEGGQALVQRLDGSLSVDDLLNEFGKPILEYIDRLRKWGLMEPGPAD